MSDLAVFAKGLAMGAANVIPGVSGGTIALISGIYERLIDALKACGPGAAWQLLRGDPAGFWQRIDGRFLSVLLAGVAISIVSLARVFEYLLEHFERHTMAFFFGLILVSIVFVAQRITRWGATTIAGLILGTGLAVAIALIAPASENDAVWYVFLCGVAAITSMILPGLSGSFVLILMGNYALVLAAVSNLTFAILVPLALGCALGLIAFSHLLSWVFKHYEQVTLATMTGFVIGSLLVIWPWKHTVTETLMREGKPPKEMVVRYEWFTPDPGASDTWVAIGLMVVGALCIAAMEQWAGRQDSVAKAAGTN